MTAKSPPKKRGPKPKTEITPPQRQTLREIERFIRHHRFAPTIQELADLLGVTSASAHQQVNYLVRKGYLKRQPGKVRGLAVLRRATSNPARLKAVPLVGVVAAGTPVLAEENIIGEARVPEDVVGTDCCFALEVSGESMKRAGIRDGDIVIVRKQQLAESGDIVVALVDGEATVKRLYIEDDRIELHPENSKFRPIKIGPETDLQIVGKVLMV